MVQIIILAHTRVIEEKPISSLDMCTRIVQSKYIILIVHLDLLLLVVL